MEDHADSGAASRQSRSAAVHPLPACGGGRGSGQPFAVFCVVRVSVGAAAGDGVLGSAGRGGNPSPSLADLLSEVRALLPGAGRAQPLEVPVPSFLPLPLGDLFIVSVLGASGPSSFGSSEAAAEAAARDSDGPGRWSKSGTGTTRWMRKSAPSHPRGILLRGVKRLTPRHLPGLHVSGAHRHSNCRRSKSQAGRASRAGPFPGTT